MTLGYDLQNKGMWNEINVYWCFCVLFLVREVEINLQIKVNIREEQVNIEVGVRKTGTLC